MADLMTYTQVVDEHYYAWGDLFYDSRFLMTPERLNQLGVPSLYMMKNGMRKCSYRSLIYMTMGYTSAMW